MDFRKSKYLIIYGFTLFLLSSCNTVKDIDGNCYHSVRIGAQIWMVENLKVTHYQNGDLITPITDISVWGSQNSGSYCDFNNESAIGKVYGHLYNFYAVIDKRNIAPKGWHVATDADWDLLTKNSSSNTVDKMKEKGITHWLPPNSSATNESGFTALPGAYRGDDGNWPSGPTCTIRTCANWWTSTNATSTEALISRMGNDMNRFPANKKMGASIRCVKN